MQKPTDYGNLFLDMNAFFASVEQQVRPELRGKPICIAPYVGNTGCCIARSYEAKDYGVTIMRVGDAKKLCPQIKIIEARPEIYVFYHRQILEVLECLNPCVEVKSIDEFNLKLTGLDRKKENAFKLAGKLKNAIREQVGDYLKCSIGISSSPWLSKVAGEIKKPDGLTAISLNQLPELYKKLKLTDLPGINLKMEAQLNRRKIKTASDFFNASLSNLSLWFGHPGRLWYFRLRGFGVDGFHSPAKSIGHSHVLAPEYRNKAAARRVLAKMAEKCAKRLRKKDLWTDSVRISISFLGGGYFSNYLKIGLVSDSSSISTAALSQYDQCQINKSPLKVSVTLFGLKQMQNAPISLFAEDEKSKRITQTLDQINDRWGDDTIYYATQFGTDEAAPNRIPFGNPGRLSF
ncbi:MAG: DNA polymerase [bacterium]